MATFRERREQLGLSPEGMAAKLLVSLSTLRNWEAGRTIPIGCMETLLRYCKEYDCLAEDLIAMGKSTSDRHGNS